MCAHIIQDRPNATYDENIHIKILEQPISCVERFRYEREAELTLIRGVNSTRLKQSWTTIQICGYTGSAVVVVSCVTSDPPYRPHPHSAVRKGVPSKKGVYTEQVTGANSIIELKNLAIQCVRRDEACCALTRRKEIKVDPFKTGFSHISNTKLIDMYNVRLCFQVFLVDSQGKYTVPMRPVVSNIISDKRGSGTLSIVQMSDCVCPADGGRKELILLCKKLPRNVSIRFYEKKGGAVVWEEYVEEEQLKVHYQTAIAFKPPMYHNLNITEPVKVFLELFQTCDKTSSKALPFEYLPLETGPKRKKRQMPSNNFNMPQTTTQRNYQPFPIWNIPHQFFSFTSQQACGLSYNNFDLQGPSHSRSNANNSEPICFINVIDSDECDSV